MLIITGGKRVPVVLIVSLVIILATGCASTPQQKEARFLENGKTRMLERDYTRAALEFRNALQVMPRDAEAHYQLALAYLAAGKLTEAVRSLRKATELNPNHSAAQVQLSELMARSGIKEVVQESEKRMHEVMRNSPNNVEALDALALSEFQLGKWQDAQQHLELALDKFPQNVRASVTLAKVNIARQDLKGAEEVLKKAVHDAPQSPEAATALGQLYMMTGRWAEAERQFQRALQINPKFVLAILGEGSAQIRLGHAADAEQTYRAVTAVPEKQFRFLYGAYLFEAGKRAAAIREFERLTKEDPEDRATRTRLVAAYLLSNRVAEAENILAAALKKNANDVDALLQESEILLRSGQEKEAETDLLRVLHFKPDSAQGHYLLAQVFRARQDGQRERQELGEAVRLAPAFLLARLSLAHRLSSDGSAKTALNVLDGAPGEQKRIVAVIIERSWALLAENNQAEARKWVSTGLSVVRAPDLLIQDAILKIRQGDYSGTRASVTEVLKQKPEDTRALRLLVASYIAQNQSAEALRKVREYGSQHPKSAMIQQFLGESLLASGESEAARQAFTAATAANPNYVAAGLALARLDFADGKLDAARERLAGILSTNSGNIESRLLLGVVKTKAGDYQGAMTDFRKVLDRDSTNVPALYRLAAMLADSDGGTDEALTLAQKAHELAPDNIAGEATLGWVLYKKGLYDTALKLLQEAVRKDGQNSSQEAAIRKYHLAMIYFKLRDRESGIKLLNAALKIAPNLPEAQMANGVVRQSSNWIDPFAGRSSR